MQIQSLVPVLLLVMVLTACASATEGATEKSTDKNLIHVSGSGTIKTTPDRCEISFSVVTKNPDVRAAQKENSRKMEAVMNVLKDSSKNNLTPSDISTTSYSISEVYNPDDTLKAKFGENVVIYEVSNTITVETKKIEQVGDLIDSAVTSGSNGVSSLTFTLSKERTAVFRNQALKIAVEKAKSDAEAVTSALGKQIGSVHEITVEDSYYPPYANNQDMRALYANGAASTPIEAGSIDVSAKVSISYEIQA